MHRFAIAAAIALMPVGAASAAARIDLPFQADNQPLPADHAPTTPGNLVANGSFESGSFAGWAPSGTPKFSSVFEGSFGGLKATDGLNQALFGKYGNGGGISQSLQTVAGQTYVVSFDLANLGGNRNSFTANFGDAQLTSFTNVDPFGYSTHSFKILARSANTLLTFDFGNSNSFYALDNVVVYDANLMPILPEPGSWALLITGFGLAGVALRRRRRSVAA